MSKPSKLQSIIAQGFDRSYRHGSKGTGSIAVSCSQCCAMVVNGVPLHEMGCPNKPGKCKCCNETIPHGYIYCEDCAQ